MLFSIPLQYTLTYKGAIQVYYVMQWEGVVVKYPKKDVQSKVISAGLHNKLLRGPVDLKSYWPEKKVTGPKKLLA